MQTASLEGGFTQPAQQSATAFRAIMEAMARPGAIQNISGAMPPAGLSQAAGAVLLTLCDAETAVYLAGDTDTPDLRQWIAFHCGSPITGPAQCAFAFGRWDDLTPLHRFQTGTSEYPDRSATLIVEQDRLMTNGAILKGPGIKSQAELNLPEIDAFRTNRALFPLGLDFIFTAGNQLAALPRSTQVEPS